MTGQKNLTARQRAHADALYEAHHDAAPDINTAVYVNPMVTISLPLPADVDAAVRAAAQHAGMRPTALIRAWIEEGLAGPGAGTVPITELDALIARHRTPAT